jgi:hypothetical protein
VDLTLAAAAQAVIVVRLQVKVLAAAQAMNQKLVLH